MNEDARYEEHEIFGTFVRQTDKGVCLDIGGEEVWLPKSQVRRDNDQEVLEPGVELLLHVPEWLARDKGLLDE